MQRSNGTPMRSSLNTPSRARTEQTDATSLRALQIKITEKDAQIVQLLESNERLIKVIEQHNEDVKRQERGDPEFEIVKLREIVEQQRDQIDILTGSLQKNIRDQQIKQLLEQNQELMKDYNELLEETLSGHNGSNQKHATYYRNHTVIQVICTDRIAQLEQLSDGLKSQVKFYQQDLAKQKDYVNSLAQEHAQLLLNNKFLAGQQKSEGLELGKLSLRMKESLQFQESLKNEVTLLQSSNESLKKDYDSILKLCLEKENYLQELNQVTSELQQNAELDAQQRMAQQQRIQQLEQEIDRLSLDREIMSSEIQSLIARNQYFQESLQTLLPD